jgi:rubrerythrin
MKWYKRSNLSITPIDLSHVAPENKDKEILRLGIIAEQDAVSLYEQMADMTEDKAIKTILLNIAKEEKTHIGEFEALLKERDSEYVTELEKGQKEVEDKTKGDTEEKEGKEGEGEDEDSEREEE